MKELLLVLAAVLASLPLLLAQPLASLPAPRAAPVPTVALRVDVTPPPAPSAADAVDRRPGPAVPIPTPLVWAPGVVGLVERAIQFAQTWLGTPYQWAGCSRRGIDCSCFVQTVLAAIGISAPRTTTTQVQWARPITPDQLQPLDLVFFDGTCEDCGANPTHVGLYLGAGQMIQAGGAAVSVQPVFSGFYGAHFARAGRPRGL